MNSEPAGNATTQTTTVQQGSETQTATSGSEPSIINTEANVDSSGSTPAVDANVNVDTNAGGGLLNADVTSDPGTITQNADLTTTESALVQSEVGMEEGISDVPVGGEAEVGLEADVAATGEPDEPVNDPADGLSTGNTTTGQLL